MEIIKKLLKRLEPFNTRGAWLGFGTGIIYFSYIFWWLWSLNLQESMGVGNQIISRLAILLIFLTCISISAFFWGIFGFFTGKFYTKNYSATLPLIIASTFTLSEYLRSVFFSIFWLGSGGAIGPNWPLGNIANFFTDIEPILRTASFWGIYGLNFYLVWLGSIIFLLFSQTRSRKYLLLQLGLNLIIILILNLNYQDNIRKLSVLPPINIAVVQTNLPSNGYSDKNVAAKDFETKLKLLKQAAQEIKSGMIIFPEGSNVVRNIGQYLNPEGMKDYFNNLSSEEILIVDSMRILENEDFVLRSVFVSSQSGIIGLYDKQILVPVGEYLPFILKIPLSVLSPKFVSWFNLYRDTSVGGGEDTFEFKNLTLKIAICSEIIPPHKIRHGNPDLIILTGSYSIWGGSSIAQSQIVASAKLRSVENSKYVILAANSERSLIINPAGKVEKMTTSPGYELLTGSIIPNKSRTWYNYIGDWPILLLSSAFFAVGKKKISNELKG